MCCPRSPRRTRLSKAIGQTAKYCDDVYLQSFPRPAAIVFERFEGDEAGPGHWWDSARSGCQVGRAACGSNTSQGRCGPNRMPSQANSVGHDRVLRSTADGVACSCDAAADHCRHGSANLSRCGLTPQEFSSQSTRSPRAPHCASTNIPLSATPMSCRRASRHQHGDWPQQRHKAGDFIIEAIGQWHQAVNLNDRPLKLLVIDQQADEKSNVVVRK